MTDLSVSVAPSSLPHQIQSFYDNLELQFDDVAQTLRGITLSFYWDTTEFRRAILGMSDFYKSSGEFQKAMFSERATLITCLAADGWLGTLRMLRPHQAEFSTSLSAEFYTPDLTPAGGAEQFFKNVGLSRSTDLDLRAFVGRSQEET